MFVLGAIAILLTAREFSGLKLAYSVTFHTVIDGPSLFRGSYVFFMALGVSQDWTCEPIPEDAIKSLKPCS